jgi:hypothetical protein
MQSNAGLQIRGIAVLSLKQILPIRKILHGFTGDGNGSTPLAALPLQSHECANQPPCGRVPVSKSGRGAIENQPRRISENKP